MSNQNESTARTLLMTLAVCLVCSILVAGAAVALKPIQTQNALLDMQRNVLTIAGLGDSDMSGAEVRAMFDQRIVARLVDLQSGRFSDDFDPIGFDPVAAAKDPSLSRNLTKAEDPASINRRENYSVVYLVEDDQGQMETLILPVRGYGLWSTMHGFIALQSDLNTVQGFGFYQHAETPGLGGEIDNPDWRNLWPGKKVYDDNGELAIRVIKGNVDSSSRTAENQVDGLAGATLTFGGVGRLVRYWLGEDGFGPFIDNLRAGEV